MAGLKPMSQTMMFAKLEKDFGKGTIMTFDKSTVAEILHWTSTGNYELDDALSWGLAGGRVFEFFGAESSGKTTQAMAALIENERRGGMGAVFDAEGTFDRDRYRSMGGNASKLFIIDAGTLEEFYDKLKILLAYTVTCDIPATAVFLVVVDTLTMIIPNDELEAEGDDQPVAAASRVNSRHLKTIDKLLPSNTCLLLLSQIRDKMAATAWGSADDNIDTPGGRIVKHVCSGRVFFKKMGQIDNGKKDKERKIIGMKIQAKVVKLKIGPPLRKVDFRIMFDRRGVDNVNQFLLGLVENKIIPAPGSGVYSIKGTSFKADQAGEVLAKFPKWTKWALDQVYELDHESINTRVPKVKPKVIESNEKT
jgi:recombination protein RecA